ncbi:MAG: hypothetical protein Q9170_005451, partial [Blastenia crenularia]
MSSLSITSTPQDQINPSVAGSDHSILQGMRSRRDRRDDMATVPNASQDETPMKKQIRPDATAPVAPAKPSEHDMEVHTPHGTPPPNEVIAPCPISVADKDALIAYKDVTAAFAVDISSSTRADGILTQEKMAVLENYSYLTREAKSRARVLPWCETANPPIKIPNVMELCPTWGTDPTVLITDRDHQNLLRQCSLWFLLTDGYINRSNIRNFASGVGEQGLHGKACVVIVFRTRPSRPTHCNISVGQAIFALAPDCAFLFHDVGTEEVYILQCKGCFRALLPDRKAEIIVDDSVSWNSIPRTSYDKLASIAVPRPREVGHDSIILESGRIVHFDDLYSDKLHPNLATEILDHDDNLKSVLLAAQNGGKSREIESWVSKQKVSRKSIAHIDRPDLGGSALRQVKTLVKEIKDSVYHPDLLEALRQNLRESHQRNWDSFISSNAINGDSVDRRNIVVDDALARVRLNRESPSSPAMMSTVSPRPVGQSFESSPEPYRPVAQSPFFNPNAPIFNPTTSYMPPPPPRLPPVELPVRSSESELPYPISPPQGSPYLFPHSPHFNHFSSPPHFPQSPFPNNPELSQLLYMKGYKLPSGPAAPQPFCGQCSLCKTQNAQLALLLKARPVDVETEGDFPTPSSYSDIRFPLAMGNFPETDIISSFLSCEKCAHFIRVVGSSPLDDSIKGAIPLVPLSNEMNRDSVLGEIDIALEGRFNKSILDQAFLSILYSKLDEAIADGNGSRLLADALRWQCRNFMPHISLPASLGSSFDPAEQAVYHPLSTTMSAILPSLEGSGPNSLVQYPVDGFVTLLKGSLDLGLAKASDDIVKQAIFQRLLYHLVEQHIVLNEQEGVDAAAKELREILQAHNPYNFDFDDLQGTYLLDEDARESFQRLKDVFDGVRKNCSGPLWSFLRLMRDTPWEASGPGIFWETVKKSDGFQKLTEDFKEPG